jgi:hypothetical protein
MQKRGSYRNGFNSCWKLGLIYQNQSSRQLRNLDAASPRYKVIVNGFLFHARKI